jgi:signal transduction histidine kinase
MWKGKASDTFVEAAAGASRTPRAARPAAEVSAGFDAHLSRLNARRVGLASWYFAAATALLLVLNMTLPSLRLWHHALAQALVALYCAALGFVSQSRRAAQWPTATLPLLFAAGTAATGLVFSFDLTQRLGANPAYVIPMFVLCLAPLWPRRLLLAVLVPVHLVYLLIVFREGQTVPFVLVMSVGGTLAVALGWFVAALQYWAERQAYEGAAAIRRQKDELGDAFARVNRLLDERREMVAIVAHDLQSPLAGIRALLRTVTEASAADGTKLREISRTCADMQDAITRLIEAHAAETGGGAPAIVDLEQLFARVAASVAPAAGEKNIAIVCDANMRRARAEPVALDRALGNLLSNAVKFSPAGSVVRLNAQSRGDGVRISVIDRGPGVPAAESESLFKKFMTLSARPTGGEPTSGLGLYIVHNLAKRMDAVAGFAPNPEGGSVFFIDLPTA